MSSLQDYINRQKAQANANPTPTQAEPAAAKPKMAFGKPTPAAAPATPDTSSAVDTGVADTAVADTPAKPTLAGFKFGGAAAVGKTQAVARVGTNASTGSSRNNELAGDDDGTTNHLVHSADGGSVGDTGPGDSEGHVYSIADIGSMDLDSLGISATGSAGAVYRDQVPATLPDRELPPELDGESQAFVDVLNGIYSIGFDPQHFGGMVRTIMTELQTHPEYIQLMCDEDVHTLMKGMQDSMGMAAVKKAEAKAKRAPKEKTQKQLTGAMSDALGGLDDSDFD